MNTFFRFGANNWKRAALLAVLGGASGLPLMADTVVQSFSYTSPLGNAPSVNETFNVTLWGSRPEFNGNSSLTGVTIALSTELRYEGVLVSPLASQSYTLRASSDFTFLLNGNSLSTALDPFVTQSGTSPGVANTSFAVPSSGQLTASSSDSLAQAVGTFLGTGTIPVQVTGDLLSTGPLGYHNLTDVGTTSPYVFLNNTKVFSMEELQLFQLYTTIVVTYQVPEATTWAAIAVTGLGVGYQWLRRRRRQCQVG